MWDIFSAVTQASVIEVPNFSAPKFSLDAILIIIPASLVVISEHIGHQVVTSEIVGKDLLKDPGLHRSLAADGISTTLSGFCGAVPTTTYGENIGVMAVTKVYSVWIIGGAAVFSMLLAWIGKASALIQTIPSPVMGGVSFLLYGMIAASGLRLLVDEKVDYSRPRNLALTSSDFCCICNWTFGCIYTNRKRTAYRYGASDSSGNAPWTYLCNNR